MRSTFKRFNIIFIFLALFIYNTNAQSIFNVKSMDGKSIHCAFDDVQKIVFSSDENFMKVHKVNGAIESFLLNELRYINFVEEVNTDIQNVQVVDMEKKISFYPNPCLDILNLKFTKVLERPTNLEFYAIDGKLLYVHRLKGAAKDFSINVSVLKQGFYLCRVNIGVSIQNFKLHKL